MEDTAARWIQANEPLEIHIVPISFLICTEMQAAYFILPVGNFLNGFSPSPSDLLRQQVG